MTLTEDPITHDSPNTDKPNSGPPPKRDFPSPACGIQTAYVGQGKPGRATWRGTMEDFALDFNAVVEAFYEHQVANELSYDPSLQTKYRRRLSTSQRKCP